MSHFLFTPPTEPTVLWNSMMISLIILWPKGVIVTLLRGLYTAIRMSFIMEKCLCWDMLMKSVWSGHFRALWLCSLVMLYPSENATWPLRKSLKCQGGLKSEISPHTDMLFIHIDMLNAAWVNRGERGVNTNTNIKEIQLFLMSKDDYKFSARTSCTTDASQPSCQS